MNECTILHSVRENKHHSAKYLNVRAIKNFQKATVSKTQLFIKRSVNNLPFYTYKNSFVSVQYLQTDRWVHVVRMGINIRFGRIYRSLEDFHDFRIEQHEF